MQPRPEPLAPPLDWPLPDFTVYATVLGPTSVTDSVAEPAGPLKRTVTGPDTAISQLPSAQAPMSCPSAADTEDSAEAVRSADGLPEDCAEPDFDASPPRDDAPSASSEPPQPIAVRALSTVSAIPAPGRRARALHAVRADVVAAMMLPRVPACLGSAFGDQPSPVPPSPPLPISPDLTLFTLSNKQVLPAVGAVAAGRKLAVAESNGSGGPDSARLTHHDCL